MINVISLIKSQINKIRRIRLTKKLVNLRNTKTFFSQQNFNDKIIHFRKGLIYQTKNVRQGRDLNFERQQTNWLVNQKQMWISSKAQVIVFYGEYQGFHQKNVQKLNILYFKNQSFNWACTKPITVCPALVNAKKAQVLSSLVDWKLIN